METEIIGLVIISLSFAVMMGCIWLLGRHVVVLQNQLRETTREYKMCKAAMDGDYGTARTLRGISSAGAKKEPAQPEPEVKPPPPGAVFTQHG